MKSRNHNSNRLLITLMLAATLSSADVLDGTKAIEKWTSPNISIGDISTAGGTATKLIFRVNNGDRAWMDASGKVGLGYSTPNAKLEVTAATDAAGGGIALRGLDNIGVIFDAYGANAAGVRSGVLDIKNTGNASKLIRLNANGSSFFNAGNVGIGSSGPTSRLEVLAATDANNGGITIKGSDNVGVIFDAYGNSSAGIRWGVLDLKYTGSTTSRIKLNSNGNSYFTGGNVGIGDTGPDRSLVVAGQVGVYGSNVGVVFKNTASSNKMWDVSQEAGMLNVNETGVQAAMTWAQGGFVGIGTKNPGYQLHISTANYKALRLTTTNANSNVFLTANPTGASTDGGNFLLNSFGGQSGFVFSKGDPDVAPQGGTELMRIMASGNVGIGTASPGFPLTIRSKKTTTEYSLDIQNSTGHDVIQAGKSAEQGVFYVNDENGNPKVQLYSGGSTFFMGGNVGVGIVNPAYPLQVNSSNYKGLKLSTSNLNSDVFLTASPTGPSTTGGNFLLNSFGGQSGFVFSNGDPDVAPQGGTDLMHIKGNGNVGIGNKDPQYKLDVTGNMNVTGELKVASVKTSTWSIAPDYVFEKNYDLKSLDQVDAYVQKNKHLPEVPSAQEIKAKGLDLAEMNLVLLRKVEELTLHAIRQEKELRNQASEIRHLKQSRK